MWATKTNTELLGINYSLKISEHHIPANALLWLRHPRRADNRHPSTDSRRYSFIDSDGASTGSVPLLQWRADRGNAGSLTTRTRLGITQKALGKWAEIWKSFHDRLQTKRFPKRFLLRKRRLTPKKHRYKKKYEKNTFSVMYNFSYLRGRNFAIEGDLALKVRRRLWHLNLISLRRMI